MFFLRVSSESLSLGPFRIDCLFVSDGQRGTGPTSFHRTFFSFLFTSSVKVTGLLAPYSSSKKTPRLRGLLLWFPLFSVRNYPRSPLSHTDPTYDAPAWVEVHAHTRMYICTCMRMYTLFRERFYVYVSGHACMRSRSSRYGRRVAVRFPDG